MNKMYTKPPQILEIEQLLGISLHERYMEQDVINNSSVHNKNIFLLNEEKEVIGLSINGYGIQSIAPVAVVSNNLQYLNFAYSRVQDISPIEGLNKLEKLHFSFNQVQDISFLENLRELKELDIRNNQISNLYSLLTLENLKTVKLEGNPNIERDFPKEVLAAGWEAVKDYINNQKDSIIFKAIKVLLLGNTNIGKSSLLHYLTTKEKPIPIESTHGITYQKIDLAGIQYHIWDFGGQEYFHATHKLFFSANALNLLLWGKHQDRENEQATHFDLDYWLRTIEQLNLSNIDNEEVIIVENKTDLNKPPYKPSLLDQAQYKKKYANLSLWFHNMCLLELKNVVALEEQIQTVSENILRVRHKYPSFYKVFWERIEKIEKDFVTLNEINYSPDTVNVEAAMRVYHNLGMLLYFPNIIPNKVFIKPQLLLDLLYEKVLSRKRKPSISFEEIEEVTQNNSLELSASEVIQLLQSFDLVFQIPAEKDLYFIPQYLEDRFGYIDVIQDMHFLHCSIKIEADNYLMNLVMLKIFANYGKNARKSKDNTYLFWKDGIIIDKSGFYLMIEFQRDKHTIELYLDKSRSNYQLQFELVDFILNVPDTTKSTISPAKIEKTQKWDSPYFSIFVSANGINYCRWENIAKASEQGNSVETENGKFIPIKEFDFVCNLNSSQKEKMVEIETLLANGKIRQAIDLLFAYSQKHQPEWKGDIIPQSARFEKNETSKREGIISQADYDLEWHKVVKALQHILAEWQ